MSTDVLQSISHALDQRIADQALEVPMLPEVASKVLQLTQDPESEAADLAKLIQADQTLAVNVMRIANSAAYSPNAQIVSLQQAITRLGMRVVAEIAISASINTRMFNTPGFEPHVNFEIQYSLASGLWAKEVARACRKNVEAAFLAGLLHDIGRPATLHAVFDIAQALKLQPTREQVLTLEEHFQQVVGLRVLEQWRMPSTVVNSVRYFHNYQQEHPVQLQTMIVVAGALLAGHFMCEEGSGECMSTEELKAQTVFGDLNLYADQVDALLERETIVNAALGAMSA